MHVPRRATAEHTLKPPLARHTDPTAHSQLLRRFPIVGHPADEDAHICQEAQDPRKLMVPLDRISRYVGMSDTRPLARRQPSIPYVIESGLGGEPNLDSVAQTAPCRHGRLR